MTISEMFTGIFLLYNSRQFSKLPELIAEVGALSRHR